MRGAYGVRKDPLSCSPGTYSSARDARLGNVPGYYLSSLTGLGRFGPAKVVPCELVQTGRIPDRTTGHISDTVKPGKYWPLWKLMVGQQKIPAIFFHYMQVGFAHQRFQSGDFRAVDQQVIPLRFIP